MSRFTLALLLLLTLVMPATAEKQKAQLVNVLFVNEGGITGKTSIVLFDNNTAQVLVSASGINYFPCDSARCLYANNWVTNIVLDCPPDLPCIRWVTIGILRKSNKIGLGIGGADGVVAYLWMVPVSLAIPDVPRVIGFGNSSLKTEKDWRDYTDKWEDAQKKVIEQQKQTEEHAAAQAQVAANLLHICLTNLKEGDPASKVYSCGYPNHTNADLHTDQLVYPDDVIVYIDKATNTVENVQWRQ